MFYVTYNIQSFTTLLLLAGGFKGLVFYVTFNNVSAIYHLKVAINMSLLNPLPIAIVWSMTEH
jgi:hypothetical protein